MKANCKSYGDSVEIGDDGIYKYCRDLISEGEVFKVEQEDDGDTD